MPKVDVAILGGGLAGNLLALQLRKHTPGVSVAVFEKSTTRGYKVGESTVEVATHYLIRRMGLSTYTYKEHLPKNGLRFFFDTPERDSELTEMSEIGVDSLPPYPSFQLDRARLERDLIEMNRAAGVDLHMPAEVSDLELSSDGDRTASG
jgi:flavin-dependent dehydrogenase